MVEMWVGMMVVEMVVLKVSKMADLLDELGMMKAEKMVERLV
jgi:hypothetical protein